MSLIQRSVHTAQNMSQVRQELPEALKQRVEAAPALVRAEATSVERLEHFVGRFLQEVTDPAVVGGMAAGQLVFVPLRAAVLRSLWNPAARGYLYGSLGSRFAAAGLASAVEAPIFWGTAKGIQQWMHHDPVTWNLREGVAEMVSLWGTMGALRLSGFAARSLLQAAAKVPTESWYGAWASGARAHPTMIHGAASVGGLYLVHWGQEQSGARPDRGAGNRAVDALVGTLQFGMTGTLANRLLGSGFQKFHSRLERAFDSRNHLPPSISDGFPVTNHHLIWEGATPAGGFSGNASGFNGRPTLVFIKGSPPGGGLAATHPIQKFILEVSEKGKPPELSILKDLVLETYRGLGYRPIDRITRYFDSRSPEEWMMGVRILVLGNQETTLKLAAALGDAPAFQVFFQKWQDQPHFKSPADIPLVTMGGLSQKALSGKKYFERMRRVLHAEPNQHGLKSFLSEGAGILRSNLQTRDILYEWEHAQSPSGRVLSVGRVDRLGVVLEFNERAHLEPPIKLFPLPPPEWVKSTLEAFGRGESWQVPPVPPPKPKPKDSSKLSLEFFAETKGGPAFNQVVRTVKAKTSKCSDEGVVTKIRQHYRNIDKGPEPEPVQLPDGGKAYVFTILYGKSHHGLVLRFDAEGKLRNPIHMGNNFAPDWVERTATLLQQGNWEPTVSPAIPVPPPPHTQPPAPSFLPAPADNPSTYALKLIDASKEGFEPRQLQLAKTLEGMLKSPTTRDFALETVERLRGLTRDIHPESQAVVRQYQLEGLEKPLTLYKPTMIPLPQPWSELFADHIRADLQKTGGIKLLVELGSNTGWLSLYLHKLGLTREFVGIDPRETARVAGRINARINLIEATPKEAIRFENIDQWDNLPLHRRADLVVAAVPAGETPVKDGGWSLLEKTLQRGSTYLSPGGRILLGVEDLQFYSTPVELLKQNGFQPTVRRLSLQEGASKAELIIIEGNLPK